MTRNRQVTNSIRAFLGKLLREMHTTFLTCLPAWAARSSRTPLLPDSPTHRTQIISLVTDNNNPSTPNNCTIIKWERVRSKTYKVTISSRRRQLNLNTSLARQPSANMALSKVNTTRNFESTKKTSAKPKIKCPTF